jgi:hypothetical protein
MKKEIEENNNRARVEIDDQGYNECDFMTPTEIENNRIESIKRIKILIYNFKADLKSEGIFNVQIDFEKSSIQKDDLVVCWDDPKIKTIGKFKDINSNDFINVKKVFNAEIQKILDL